MRLIQLLIAIFSVQVSAFQLFSGFKRSSILRMSSNAKPVSSAKDKTLRKTISTLSAIAAGKGEVEKDKISEAEKKIALVQEQLAELAAAIKKVEIQLDELGDVELVVVNDGSNFEDWQKLLKDRDFTYIHNKQNLGVGKSKNILFKELLKKKCDHIFIIENQAFAQSIFTASSASKAEAWISLQCNRPQTKLVF
jgi:ABC-type Fe3+-hydroxamate transport system substrate-binding protein